MLEFLVLSSNTDVKEANRLNTQVVSDGKGVMTINDSIFIKQMSHFRTKVRSRAEVKN